MNCPGQEELFEFLVGRLPEQASDTVADHLDACTVCKAAMAALDEGADTLVARLRRPTGNDPLASDPCCQEAIARAEAMWPGGEPPLDLGQLGEYELLEKLGQGGMGAVYKARHTRLDRLVALKVLSQRSSADPQAIARFDREMKAIGQLNHPNIVAAHDAREIDGTRFLVMEHVEGVDLGQLARRHGPLPVADACELVRQAAVGLQYAYEHGLVHRDIKPSNLMLALSTQVSSLAPRPSPLVPVVKILDLGLALLKAAEPTGEEPTATQPGGLAPFSPDQGPPQPTTSPAKKVPDPFRARDDELTATHQVMGTASYMAPEQANDSHRVDIRGDIYSLGCTLYKLLSGQPPFPATQYRTAAEQMTAHATRPVEPIQHLRPQVPSELAAVVERMLAKNPSERFATPAEVAEALQPFAAGSDLVGLLSGVPAATGGLSQFSRSENGTVPFPDARAISPKRRRRWLALATGGAAAVVLLGILLTVSTSKGTVQLEFSDAEAARQCTISIDGDEIRLENLGAPIKLRPGKHELRITHGDLEIETREFTVLRRGTQVLRVSIPGVRASEPPESAQLYAERARAYADREAFGPAIAAYTEAIRLDPKSAEYYFGRAEAGLCDGGDLRQSTADYNEAIRLDPSAADARVSLAMIHFVHGRTEPAERDWREALRITPDCVERCLQEAEVCRQKKRPRRAFYEERKGTALLSAMVQADKGNLGHALSALRHGARASSDVASARLRWASCWLPALLRGEDKLPGIVFVSDMPWVRSSCGWGTPVPKRNTTWAQGPVLLGAHPYGKGISTYPFEDVRPADVVLDISTGKFTTFKTQLGVQFYGTVQFQVLVDGKVKHDTGVLRFGTVRPVSLDVARAKEVVLRVLNGGDGNASDGACWGYARFVQAGAEDPLEVPPPELRSATDANAALLLAEVWWRLDEKDRARRWFDTAAAWMGKNPAEAEKLRPYRAEAAKLLGIAEKPPTAKEKPRAK